MIRHRVTEPQNEGQKKNEEHQQKQNRDGRYSSQRWFCIIITTFALSALLWFSKPSHSRSGLIFIMDPPPFVQPDLEMLKPLKELDPEMLRTGKDLGLVQVRDSTPLHGTLGEGRGGWDLSLNREFPDFRGTICESHPAYTSEDLPAASVVIIFSNEPLETLLRTVHSVLNGTPALLLQEIVLVDDSSTDRQLIEDLRKHLQSVPKTVLLSYSERQGIPKARWLGVQATTSDVFVVLDSHVEVEPGWLEPMLFRIKEDPLTIVMPIIDTIDMPNRYSPLGTGIGCHIGIIWRMQDHAFIARRGLSPADRIATLDSPQLYTTSPVMAGGLFAASRRTFEALGGYDFDMQAWGTENVEFSFRLWQCGARLECSYCSRIAHIFDRGQFYEVNQKDVISNRIRAAEGWMDEYKEVARHFSAPFEHIKGTLKRPDVSRITELRDRLKCKPFKWFLKEVYPESHLVDFPEGLPRYGEIINRHLPDLCIGKPNSSQWPHHGDQVGLVSRKLIGHCPHFAYWARTAVISSGFDDEAALTITQPYKMDWNRDWDPEHMFEINIMFDHETGENYPNIVRIESMGLCLIANKENKLDWQECQKRFLDEREHWIWNSVEQAWP